MSVNERIKFLRKDFLKIKQGGFAESLKMRQASISEIEAGGAPSVETIIKIGNTYKINLHWLLSGEGEMTLGETKPRLASPESAITNETLLLRIVELEKKLLEKINDLPTAIRKENLRAASQPVKIQEKKKA